MLFDGNNAYVTVSYAIYFVSIAAIIGAIFLHRKTTTRKIAQLNTLLQGQNVVKSHGDVQPGGGQLEGVVDALSQEGAPTDGPADASSVRPGA